MARVADGQRDAFAELYDRFGRNAYGLARRICRDPGIAEDVVQDVFSALWRAPQRFDPARGSVATWLLMVTHHRAVDAVRRESGRRHRTPPAAEPDAHATAPTGPGVDVEALDAVAAGHVRAALESLGPAHREVLTLAYFGGYTQTEISTLTGVALGTVKSRTFTALRRLRTMLAPLVSADDRP